MEFNEKLQKLRKEKGMSQENSAEMLDVSRQAISKWESGQSYPEMDKLIALSDLFGVTMDSLVKSGELQKDKDNNISEPFWLTRGTFYEYKSKRTLFGLPLIHIHIGRGFKKAKGIIAVGNNATGIISIGLLSKGIISFGLISLGLVSIGIFSLGLLLAVASVAVGIFAVGAVSVGIFTIGALSIGMFSIGACSVASHIAIGDYANGHIAIGRIAHGTKTFIDNSPNHDFSLIHASEVKEAIHAEYPKMWGWIVDFMTAMFRN
jgi:transcriptional regulator with XRE-family HTH domain